MRCGKAVKYHIATGRLTKIYLPRLAGARGHLYTIKPGQICAELFFGEHVPYCAMKVREHLMSVLHDAIVAELTNNKYIVVLIDKAWEVLGCGQHIG